MKASILLSKTEKPNKQDKYPVKLRLFHEKKIRRKTISHSTLIDWDLLKQLPKFTHPDFEDLLSLILEIKQKAESIKFREIDDFDEAYSFLLDNKTQKKLTKFGYWIKKRIKEMEGLKRFGNAAAYGDALRALEIFDPGVMFEDLNPAFFENFKKFHKEKGNKNTTIRAYLASYRANYNAAVRAGLVEDTTPFLGAFDGLPIKKRRAKNRYLDLENLKKLENANLKHRSYQRAIDFSMLQFYLCGCDLVDIYYLKKNDIVKDRVFLRRRKLGEKSYEFDVKLVEKAKAIINKYKNDEGEFLFPWNKAWTSYKTFRSNHTRNLKIVQKRLKVVCSPKDANLTSKVMRHTFATLGKFERIEEDLLRELMGHERNDIDTVYKDKYPENERDAAQLKVINI